jgi:hypothetical protein
MITKAEGTATSLGSPWEILSCIFFLSQGSLYQPIYPKTGLSLGLRSLLHHTRQNHPWRPSTNWNFGQPSQKTLSQCIGFGGPTTLCIVRNRTVVRAPGGL